MAVLKSKGGGWDYAERWEKTLTTLEKQRCLK